MRHILLTGLLVLSLAVPGLAAASGTLPYHLRLSGTIYSGTTPSGTMAGTLGGLPVRGAYADGRWTLAAFGRLFASGTYECVRTCTFVGGTLAGKSTRFVLTSAVPTSDTPAVTASGRFSPRGLRTRSGWISAVSQWAQRSNLSRAQRNQAVADAARM